MSRQSDSQDWHPNVAKSRAYFIELPPPSADENVDLLALWRELMCYKLLIASIVGLATMLAIGIALTMEPVYRSQVLMAPTTTDDTRGNLSALGGEFGGLASLAGIKLADNNNVDQAIAVLRSRSFTEEFIISHDLMPILFADRWDEVSNSWKVDGDGAAPTYSDAYRLFDETVRTVSQDQKTGIVALGIEWFDRELSANWANLLVAQLNENLRRREIAEAERSIEFLYEQLEQNSVIELRQGIFRLIEHQIESVMLANVREEFVFKILDPAVVSDIDDPVKPNRRFIVIATFVGSGIFALVLAVVLISIRKYRQIPGDT